ncbi:MAG TPA: hypothetical protein VM889_14370 [Candidatus Thermoplasmatota archaeon]|nr:hypothetical protein [Candidatus Thermoplasmatota archaeon]
MRVALAWAGGLGSVLALDALLDAGHDVTLVNVVDAASRRDPARGAPDFLLDAQMALTGARFAQTRFDGGVQAKSREPPAFAPVVALAARASGAEALAVGGALDGAWTRAAHAAGLEPLAPVAGLDAASALARARERGHRAFTVAVAQRADAARLGRFVDETDGAPRAGDRTLVVASPRFARRLDVAAGEAREHGDGMALDVTLRGC